MKARVLIKNKTVFIMEAIVVLGIMAVIPGIFDYYFALNDDVLINDIVSGRYLGIPDVHNVSMAIPLNVLLACLNHMLPSVPWFGLLLLFSQFGSLYLIVVNLTKQLEDNKEWRNLCLIFLNILFFGLMAEELVLVQYTYTAALLMTSATLCLYTMDFRLFFTGRGIWKYICILLQFLLAYCMRTEIFLFLLPFVLILTVVKYYKENGIRINGDAICKWGIIWGSMIAFVIGMQCMNNYGYSKEGWKEYKEFDAYRTQLYDFLELPPFKENVDFYRSIGLSEIQYELLDKYNFALDDRITANTMKQVVNYINEKRLAGYSGLKKFYWKNFTLPLREGLWSYSHRCLMDPIVSQDDYPWNVICMTLYLLFLLLTCFSKKWIQLLWIGGIFSVRTILWLYIILKQRTPVRVTHSLFIMEIVCLLLLIIEGMVCQARQGKKLYICDRVRRACTVVFLVMAGIWMITGWLKFHIEYMDIKENNNCWARLTQYCHENENDFFFIGVYSSVNFSERMFKTKAIKADNYDICGGWLSKSPLSDEKYSRFGISSVEDALINNQRVYFVITHKEPIDWLIQYYREKGIQIEVNLQEVIAGQFDVYSLTACEASAQSDYQSRIPDGL